jgi:hypothetical protein
MLLKKYNTMEVLAHGLGVDEDTLCKWAYLYLKAVAELDASVVSNRVLFCVRE